MDDPAVERGDGDACIGGAVGRFVAVAGPFEEITAAAVDVEALEGITAKVAGGILAVRHQKAAYRCEPPQIPTADRPLFGTLALARPFAAPRPHDAEHRVGQRQRLREAEVAEAVRSVRLAVGDREQVVRPIDGRQQVGVIRMTRNETKELGCDEKLFKQVVKTTFNQRRKTLRNSIKPILGKDCPLTEDILFNKRPEQLSVAEFIDLTNKVEEALKTAGNAQ